MREKGNRSGRGEDARLNRHRRAGRGEGETGDDEREAGDGRKEQERMVDECVWMMGERERGGVKGKRALQVPC